MLATIHNQRDACDVVTPAVVSEGLVLMDLVDDALVLLEAGGEDRMAAMRCVLGPAGETDMQAIRRLSTTLPRLQERFDPVGR